METEQTLHKLAKAISRRYFISRSMVSGAAFGIFSIVSAQSKDIFKKRDEHTSSILIAKDTTKTVLIINAHLTYPGMSEGTLNQSFCDTAKAFFLSKAYKVLETKIETGYTVEQEIEKHLEADLVILQTPVNWISTPWIYKKYVDEVFTSALKSQKFLSGDGRVTDDPSKQYGTGGKMKGKKFMISATWNAAQNDFYDPKQYLYQGKGPEDVFYNITTNYRFSGYSILPGYNCFDVFRNKHIKSDIENYPKHLAKVLNL